MLPCMLVCGASSCSRTAYPALQLRRLCYTLHASSSQTLVRMWPPVSKTQGSLRAGFRSGVTGSVPEQVVAHDADASLEQSWDLVVILQPDRASRAVGRFPSRLQDVLLLETEQVKPRGYC